MVILKRQAYLLLFMACSCSMSRPVATGEIKTKPQQAVTDLTTLKFTVEPAPEWSSLFKRSSGWFGADGIFAIPENGQETAQTGQESETTFLFSDTLIKPGGKPASVFIPNTPDSKPGEYFWLGDGFVNQALGNATYLFAYRMRYLESKGPFKFEEAGNVLIKIPAGSKPPYRNQQQMDTPFFITGEDPNRKGSLGAGILVNTKSAGAARPDGYV